MKRESFVLGLLVLCNYWGNAQNIVERIPTKEAFVRELLQLPAPAPPAGVPGKQQPQNSQFLSPEFTEPGKDASSEVLAMYWSQADSFSERRPEEEVQQRLLEYGKQKPDLLPRLLRYLPQDPSSSTQIKKLYDQNATSKGEEWSQAVRSYLQTYGGFFHKELQASARKAKDDSDGSVKNSEELVRLAKVDWKLAEPLLIELKSHSHQRTQVLAETLLYEHYSEQGEERSAATLRSRLKAIVSDKKAFGYSRDRALTALLETRWEGRDEWYLSLFADASLRQFVDGYMMYSPLTGPVVTDPDRWIPEMVRLLGSKDRAVHDAAVSCLVVFNLKSARKDALLPLLPWLFNPKWSSASDRLRLIQSTDELDLKEAIPGLIAVLGNSDDAERSYAAEALAHFRDPRAAPALRAALQKEKSSTDRFRILKGLIACGGVSASEAAQAVESFARFTATSEGKEKWEESSGGLAESSVAEEVSLGGYIAEREPPAEEVTTLLLKRIASLQTSQKPVAVRLQQIITKWPSEKADLAAIQRLEAGTISATDLAALLRKSEQLKQTMKEKLVEMEQGKGFSSGVATVLLKDKSREVELLSKEQDEEALEGLFASARLVREELPVTESLIPLLQSKNAVLREATEAFLITEDSPEARGLIFAQHKGEAFIIGSRENYDPGHFTYPAFDRMERQLQEEVKARSDSLEIYALLTAGYWGDAGQIVIRARDGHAVMMQIEDSARYLLRKIPDDAWRQFQDWLQANSIDDLGPLNLTVMDGLQYEYVHLQKDGGRRIFMNNPGTAGSGGSLYDQLCLRIMKLASSALPAELHYRTADSIAGFEVLIADAKIAIGDIWKNGDDLRVAAFPTPSTSNRSPLDSGIYSLKDLDSLPAQSVSWIALQPKPHKTSEPPTAYRKDVLQGGTPSAEQGPWNADMQGTFVLGVIRGSRTHSYRVGSWEKHPEGLWEIRKDQKANLIARGIFANPVVSPDGRWMILSSCAKAWNEANFAVQVNLETGKTDKVSISPGARVTPLAWVEGRGRVLVRRNEKEVTGSEQTQNSPEYWLVDTETGRAEQVQGEFTPFEETANRPLQAAANGESWAAIYDEQKNVTRIGSYSLTDFRFHPLFEVPKLSFNSRQMWMDPAQDRVYVCYKGQLVRMKLSSIARN